MFAVEPIEFDETAKCFEISQSSDS